MLTTIRFPDAVWISVFRQGEASKYSHPVVGRNLFFEKNEYNKAAVQWRCGGDSQGPGSVFVRDGIRQAPGLHEQSADVLEKILVREHVHIVRPPHEKYQIFYPQSLRFFDLHSSVSVTICHGLILPAPGRKTCAEGLPFSFFPCYVMPICHGKRIRPFSQKSGIFSDFTCIFANRSV